jgi:hypothetical protein
MRWPPRLIGLIPFLALAHRTPNAELIGLIPFFAIRALSVMLAARPARLALECVCLTFFMSSAVHFLHVVGGELRKAREREALTQEQLSFRAGVSRVYPRTRRSRR